MTIINVTYTTTAGYSEQNQANIRQVMADLRQLNHPGIDYRTCVAEDGKTFIHTAYFNNDEDRVVLNALPSFKHFQEQLKFSNPEVSPKQQQLTLVGASKSIFNI